MNTINFTNNIQSNSLSSEVNKRLENKENFTAINKEQLKQDVAEFQEKAQDHAKENFISQTLKNIAPKDVKKFAISLTATLATVVGLAILGNKSSNKMAQLGLQLDDFLLNQKWYQSISGFFKKGKDGIVKTLRKSKTIDNIMDTFKNRPAKAKCDFSRGYGRGFVSIFSLTPVDILKKAFANMDESKQLESLKKLVGDKKASIFSEFLQGKSKTILDNKDFCTKLTEAIKENFNLKSNADLLNFFKALQNGKYQNTDFSELINVNMTEKGLGSLAGAWWPVNIIDSIGSKISKGKWKNIGRGNLGDSMIKFNVVNGSLAKTAPAKLLQQAITIPTESISNFVNDKSGMGAFLCIPIMSLYNNVQDAPKEKRAATIADDYVGTMGNIAISTPLAYGATYALASLKNLNNKQGFLAKPLKLIGEFFGMGLDRYKDGVLKTVEKSWRNVIPRYLGGALRFGLIMFAFSPFFSKPIKSAINKIFGKPYDANEAAKEKQLQEQRNTVIPELGITQGELNDKIEANPDAVAKLQKDPMLLREIQKDPKKILDILDGKEIQTKPKDKLLSPANLNLTKNTNNKRELFNDKQQVQQEQQVQSEEYKIKDTATYIPSSEFTVKPTLNDIQIQEYQRLMNDSDKILKKAEKYI